MVVVQEVRLFGSETWVLTPWLEKSREDFHHRAVRQMAGTVPKHQRYGTWVYTPIGAALEMVGLEDTGVYIACLQNTVAQYIVTHTIMDLCLAAEQKLGMRLSMRWSEQPTLNILGIRAGHASAEGGEDTGTGESEG